MAPVSTTVWASSGECLATSLRAEAAMRFRATSGSWRQSTSRGSAPASTTAWDRSAHGKQVFGGGCVWCVCVSEIVHVRTFVVPSDVPQGPGRGLLHPGVELLQGDDERVQRPTVHHRLGQRRGVSGHRTQHEGCCLLIEPLHTHITYTHTHVIHIHYTHIHMCIYKRGLL